MKVAISPVGELCITSENETEVYALIQWMDTYTIKSINARLCIASQSGDILYNKSLVDFV